MQTGPSLFRPVQASSVQCRHWSSHMEKKASFTPHAWVASTCRTSADMNSRLYVVSLTISICQVSSLQCWICSKLYSRIYAQPGCSTLWDKCECTMPCQSAHITKCYTALHSSLSVYRYVCTVNKFCSCLCNFRPLQLHVQILKQVLFCCCCEQQSAEHCSAVALLSKAMSYPPFLLLERTLEWWAKEQSTVVWF